MSIPNGWTRKRFDQLGEILSGSTPSTTNRSYWDGDIVWVTPNDLSKLNTPYLHNSAKRITKQGLSGCSTTLLTPGSIVISSRAPIGYVAIPKVEFCTNQGCKSIALKTSYNSEFTYYNIEFNIDKLKQLGEGTTFAEISKFALAGIELDFPKAKPEQSKIAEILSTEDRAIEQTQGLIAKQQRIKTGLMQDLLTRGIDENGNLRSEETHKFKDSPIGRIPVEWETVSISSVLAQAPKNGLSPVELDSWHGTYMLGLGCLTNNGFRAEQLKIAPPATTDFKKAMLRSGDFLISRSNTRDLVGLVGIYEDVGAPCIYPDLMVRLVFLENVAT